MCESFGLSGKTIRLSGKVIRNEKAPLVFGQSGFFISMCGLKLNGTKKLR